MMPLVAILEDDREIAMHVSRALSDDGFKVVSCHSVKEFERELEFCAFDLLLIDITLPDGNGLDVVKDMKNRSSAGIIFLSGRNDEIDQVIGLELGADDYIAKPFRLRELRARVKSVYRRVKSVKDCGEGASGLSEAQVLHGLAIVREARLVRRIGGEIIDLTTLEFDVLNALTSRVNQVLSRDQIMERVRGPDWSAYDRTIDGLISRLRSKLFPDGSGINKIKTVRGIGYMMASDH